MHLMTTLAVLTKRTRTGDSNWHFVEGEDGFFCMNDRTEKVLNCKSKEELRKLYRTFVGYGFKPQS